MATVDDLAGAVSACREEVSALRAALDGFAARTVAEHDRTIHALRVVRDDDARARERLWKLRGSSEYEMAYDEDEPLVTVIITTYDNWHLLRERALPSVLAQTYERFECIVVGDAAPPQAAEAVRSFSDERLRFINLPYRGPYPPTARDAWLISGTAPFNTALATADGRWLGSVSDDDALSHVIHRVAARACPCRARRGALRTDQSSRPRWSDRGPGGVSARVRAVGHAVLADPRRSALSAASAH